MKVLAIVPYQLDFCAGQRFRIELWAKELSKRGIEVDFFSYSNTELSEVLYQPRRYTKKATIVLTLFIKQIFRVFKIKKPDLIFIYREAALFGPPIIEKIVRKWNIPIIYDIDEPLFVPYISPSNGALTKLKFISKIDDLLRLSDSVFAVNDSIAEYARKFNKHVDVVPLGVDINRYSPSKSSPSTLQKLPIITWVGTQSNQPNIELAVAPLREVYKTHDFQFRIIADVDMQIEGLNVDFVKWKYEIEVPKLQEAAIGIVPVRDSVWTPWKFFFKTIQFMSLGLPVVATAVASNLDIIKDGENGFLVKTEEEWVEKIKLLLDNEDLRKEMGKNARNTILKHFDIEQQYNFIERRFRELAL